MIDQDQQPAPLPEFEAKRELANRTHLQLKKMTKDLMRYIGNGGRSGDCTQGDYCIDAGARVITESEPSRCPNRASSCSATQEAPGRKAYETGAASDKTSRPTGNVRLQAKRQFRRASMTGGSPNQKN